MMETTVFQEIVWQKGRELYRDMPWRNDTRPYYVLVSEIMLQQTQVDRVIPKFAAFIEAFPDVRDLAAASLADVLLLWSGLGYNRRAKFLHEAAKMVVNDFGGTFPDTIEGLVRLPGVGPNTAGAIMAYSFSAPVTFVETNIRTVYFQHFFTNEVSVSDTRLREVVAATVDIEHPREWYWALMDYGTYLKRIGAGRNSQSSHYKKQAPLKGSIREIRGQILKYLAGEGATLASLKAAIIQDDRFEPALEGLMRDGLVDKTNDRLHLAH